MKKTIYLHIGYPKTATTSLQKHYFLHLDNTDYLGKFHPIKENGFLFNNQIISDLIYAKVENIEKYNKEFSNELYNQLKNNKVLISEEALIGSSLIFRQEKKNLILIEPLDLIKSIKTLFNDKLFKIKIIITIRNQVELIPSLYAQSFRNSYSKIENIDTFKKFLSQVLENPNFLIAKHLNYNAVVEKFEKEFGENNIEVLSYEEFIKEKSSFLEKLSNFTSTQFVQYSFNTETIENQRSMTDGKKRYDQLSISSLIKKIKKSIFPNKNFGLSQYLNILNIEIPFTKKPGAIILTEKEKNLIFERFQKDNKKLSYKYKLNLDKYGYYK